MHIKKRIGSFTVAQNPVHVARARVKELFTGVQGEPEFLITAENVAEFTPPGVEIDPHDKWTREQVEKGFMVVAVYPDGTYWPQTTEAGLRKSSEDFLRSAGAQFEKLEGADLDKFVGRHLDNMVKERVDDLEQWREKFQRERLSPGDRLSKFLYSISPIKPRMPAP